MSDPPSVRGIPPGTVGMILGSIPVGILPGITAIGIVLAGVGAGAGVVFMPVGTIPGITTAGMLGTVLLTGVPVIGVVAIGDTIIIMPLPTATVKVDDLLTSVMEADEVLTVVIGPVTHVAIR